MAEVYEHEWEPKDPDETDRFGVDWRLELNGAAIVASTWSLPTQAGLTVVDDTEFDDNFAYIILSGGTAGLVAELVNSIDTDDGRLDLEKAARLAILDSTGTAIAAGYSTPTVAQFLSRFPKFQGSDSDAIADALGEGAGRVSESWVEADYPRAIMLYAAHILTLDGHGSGAEAKFAGLESFSRIKSGSLELERRSGSGVVLNTLNSTAYGRRFAELQRLNFAGPLVIITDGSRALANGSTE